jgi:hypothetical protein
MSLGVGFIFAIFGSFDKIRASTHYMMHALPTSCCIASVLLILTLSRISKNEKVEKSDPNSLEQRLSSQSRKTSKLLSDIKRFLISKMTASFSKMTRLKEPKVVPRSKNFAEGEVQDNVSSDLKIPVCPSISKSGSFHANKNYRFIDSNYSISEI